MRAIGHQVILDECKALPGIIRRCRDITFVLGSLAVIPESTQSQEG